MFEKIKKTEAWATVVMIVALAWPTVIEQVMQTLVQYIDTGMVSVLGTQQTAAVGATSTVGWLVISTLSAFSVGFLAIIARAFGAGKPEETKHAVAQAVLLTLVGGIIATIIPLTLSKQIPIWMQVDEGIRDLAASYFFVLYLPTLPRTATIIFGTVLRAAGDTKTPMKVGILMNIINIILNYFFIYEPHTLQLLGLEIPMFGFGWGVVGAAAASAIAITVGGILITRALYTHPILSPKGCSLKPDMKILIPCFRISLPNMLQRFGTSFGFVAFSSMINSIGELATATHTICNTVESAFYIPGYGMQTAAATLTGNAYGARDNQKMKALARMFIPIEIGLMILSGGALFISAPALVGIFSDNPEVITLGSTVLRMVAVSEPFYGFSIIVEGMMMGVGKTKEPFVYNIIGMWLVRIVGTFICTQIFDMGLVSAWACMIGHNILVCIFYFITYSRGTWNPLNKELPN